ncbi:MAG TPA: response regulator transcription factor [Burkholderiaceae bacterium]|nr:response regulator transcription factor [Burkholderiaceae bacterium]
MIIASLEDDLAHGELIQSALTAQGYQCRIFTASSDLLTALGKGEAFDLILLDWEVPDLSGLDVLHWIRTNKGYDTPVMFVTSRTAEEDLVTGLSAGADDYLIKPIRVPELLARTSALLRRSGSSMVTTQAFDYGVYHVDQTSQTIRLRNRKIDLAPKEYELAALFLRNPGRLFSRDVLSQSVWNRDIPATSRTLDTHLSNIRRKLKLTPENGVRLHASYALGYRLERLPDSA